MNAIVGLIALAAALVAGWFMAKLKGRSEQRDETQTKINQQAADAANEVQHVQRTIDAATDADIDDKLAKWVRNPTKRRD